MINYLKKAGLILLATIITLLEIAITFTILGALVYLLYPLITIPNVYSTIETFIIIILIPATILSLGLSIYETYTKLKRKFIKDDNCQSTKSSKGEHFKESTFYYEKENQNQNF